jgi:hypothetical protein
MRASGDVVASVRPLVLKVHRSPLLPSRENGAMTLEAAMARLVATALACWVGSNASWGGPYAGSFSSEVEVD